ncbi:MAG: twin-arginine translocation signal domain-containing protein [Aldersonia sp.]|nr:twin-arginine translocation signal domain-containing protein [Aldersonia sp.]
MGDNEDASLTRRRFLAGVAGTGIAMLGVGSLFAPEATAQSADAALPPVNDTLNGILSFVVPGNDAYSRHQGVATDRPGGVNPGSTASLARTFDQAVPFPVLGPAFGINLPGAAAISALVNLFVATVDAGARGPFTAPFANLTHANKAQVFELIDTTPLLPGLPVKFVANAIPTLAAFAAYAEVSAFDARSRTLTGRPVGWELSRYERTSDGWDEFIGYYRGIR